MTPDDYLLAAWQRAAPGAAVERGFPRGFWPDVARAAVELALAGDLSAPLSFRPTMCGNDEGLETRVAKVRGIDLGKLEIML